MSNFNFIFEYFTAKQGSKQGQKFMFSQCIIQCDNKNSWFSFTVLLLNYRDHT